MSAALNPSIAIQAQITCAEWWSTMPGLETTVSLYAGLLAIERRQPVDERMLAELYGDREWVGREMIEMARAMAADIYEAAPFYVDAPIVDALVGASANLPAEVPLGLSQFPAPSGFVFLASNTLRIPTWGRLGTAGDTVRALSWAPQRISREWQIHPDGTPNPGRVRLCLHVWVDRGRWPLTRRVTLYTDELASWRGAVPQEMGDPRLIAEPGRSQELAETVWSFLLALGAFVHERLVDDAAEAADRATRRMMANKGLPELPPIRTIRLRQREAQAHDPGSREVEWSCQWMVSSHWRRQYHPSTGEHRWRPIPAYVKGPPTKPLKVGGPALRSVVR